MTIYRDPRTGLYRYDFSAEHKRYTKAGFATRREAAEAEAARRLDVKAGVTGQWPTFALLAADWLSDLSTRASEGWVKQCAYKLNRYAGPIWTRQPGQIRPLTIQRLLTEVGRQTSPKAANELRKILAAAFRWGVDMGAIAANPVLRVRRFPVEPPELEVISTAHLRLLIVAADARLSRFLTVQALTGARRAEIARLRLDDCRLDADPPRIALRHAKGGARVRWRPLPARAALALREQITFGARGQIVWPGRITGSEIARNTLDGNLRDACVRAQIPRYGFHAVRRWAATSAMESGIPDKAVAEFLGHSDTSITSRYVDVAEFLLAEVGDRLAERLGAA